MPQPTYRDVVRPSLIDPSMPDNGKAQASMALANAFRDFATIGSGFAANLSAEQGRRQGAEAGRTDHPAFRTGMGATTAFGRAYNDAATRSYAIKAEAEADESAMRLEAEAGSDPDFFRQTYGARRDAILAEAPAEARPILAEAYDRRMAISVQRLLGVQQQQQRQQALGEITDGINRSTDRLAQLRASNDPLLQGMADEEQVKLDLLINGGLQDGTLSQPEAAALRLDAARKGTAQLATYRFRNELNNPMGDPVAFIRNLMEMNKTSEVLPPDEEEKLVGSLLQELQQHNALIAAGLRDNDLAQKKKWAAGEKVATEALLNGTLSIGQLLKMSQDGDLDPAISRTLRDDLLQGSDRPDDNRERFRVETTLLKQSEDDIAHNSKLSWKTRRELIEKRREMANGWKGTQQAREGENRIDRALKILPGVNPAALSEDQLEKRDQAITEWYNTVDALPEDERQGKAISTAEDIINRIVRTNARGDADRYRKRISDLQAALPGMDEEKQKQTQLSIARYEKLLREVEAKSK